MSVSLPSAMRWPGNVNYYACAVSAVVTLCIPNFLKTIYVNWMHVWLKNGFAEPVKRSALGESKLSLPLHISSIFNSFSRSCLSSKSNLPKKRPSKPIYGNHKIEDKEHTHLMTPCYSIRIFPGTMTPVAPVQREMLAPSSVQMGQFAMPLEGVHMGQRCDWEKSFRGSSGLWWRCSGSRLHRSCTTHPGWTQADLWRSSRVITQSIVETYLLISNCQFLIYVPIIKELIKNSGKKKEQNRFIFDCEGTMYEEIEARCTTIYGWKHKPLTSYQCSPTPLRFLSYQHFAHHTSV